MTAAIEGNHTGEFILSGGDQHFARQQVMLVLTGIALQSGTVLGQITLGAATSAAKPGNVGNGLMGSVTLGPGAKVGDYRVTMLEPATNAGAFTVEDPEGINCGVGTVGAQFVGGGLTFTLADGAVDFVAGDQFVITVPQGSGKYRARDDAATDGSAVAAGILFTPCAAMVGQRNVVVIARHAEVNGALLIGSNPAAVAALKTRGIIVR